MVKAYEWYNTDDGEPGLMVRPSDDDPETPDIVHDWQDKEWVLKEDHDVEVAELKAEAGIRKTSDPILRFHNLCRGLEAQADDSPYTDEAWEALEQENKDQRNALRQIAEMLGMVATNFPQPDDVCAAISALMTKATAEFAAWEGRQALGAAANRIKFLEEQLGVKSSMEGSDDDGNEETREEVARTTE